MASTIFKIGGKDFSDSVIILSLRENFEKLYGENTGRIADDNATMYLDCIGTFLSHQVSVMAKPGNIEAFQELYDLCRADTSEGISVEIVSDQDTILYDAYISSGGRDCKRIVRDQYGNSTVYWGTMDIKLTPMKKNYSSQ